MSKADNSLANSNNANSLENFIKTASNLLAANESNLRALAVQIDDYLTTTADSNGHEPIPDNLSYLQEQTNYLSRQSNSLKKFLEGKCRQVPSNYPLSRIQILQQQEEERARTAKDLEDTTAQLLANAIFELAAVKQLVGAPDNLNELLKGINALQEELESGLAHLRFLIADLEPTTMLGSFGLMAGLRRYLEKFSEQTGIEIIYQTQTVIEQLPDIVELAIFRIIQEALQNIHLHAKAKQAQVIVEAGNDTLKFSVLDDGSGFNTAMPVQAQKRLGLVGMKDLADLLEGELHLKSDKNKGTQVILTIPYPHF